MVEASAFFLFKSLEVTDLEQITFCGGFFLLHRGTRRNYNGCLLLGAAT
jgi:hypothetical protein